jgi:transcription elongation factor GreA
MAKKQTSNDNAESLIVTPAGFAEMQAELEERLQRTIEIAHEIDEARKLGDLKENEPYIAAMQRKEMNDTRVEELKYLISIAQVVDNSGSVDIIGIGSKIEIENTANKAKRIIQLVGRQASQESNPVEGKISIDSPLGKALNGKKVGTEVEVQLPIGLVNYKIVRCV